MINTPRTDAAIKFVREQFHNDDCPEDYAAYAVAHLGGELAKMERDLAAAKDTISKYHERIISQHAQIDDLKWSLWKIEGKHKAAILEVITKLAAAQEARQRAEAIAESYRKALDNIETGLRKAGASLPAPEITGTIEGSMNTGMCIALCLVVTEREAIVGEKP